jgi:hypothetical protein
MTGPFDRRPTLSEVVDGAFDKLTDRGSLIGIQRELIRLNQFFQEERNTAPQRKESFTFVYSFGVMVNQMLVPAKNGWTFTIKQLTLVDNDPAFASAVTIYEQYNGPSNPLMYFVGGGTAASRIKNLFDSQPFTIRPNSGLSAMIATATTVTFVIRGEYIENIK